MKYLVLLSGKINSGKNQYAKFLKYEFENRGLTVREDLYAKDLKDFCSEDFILLNSVLEQKVEEIKSNIGVYFNLYNKVSLDVQNMILNSLDNLTFNKNNFYEDKTDITRTLLQIYGTDIARKRFDDNFWIKKLAERINNDKTSDVIIITDVRFPNEINDLYEYIPNWRIVPILIERRLNRNEIINEHMSETALDDFKFWEYIVDNNSTLEDLKLSSQYVSIDILLPD